MPNGQIGTGAHLNSDEDLAQLSQSREPEREKSAQLIGIHVQEAFEWRAAKCTHGFSFFKSMSGLEKKRLWEFGSSRKAPTPHETLKIEIRWSDGLGLKVWSLAKISLFWLLGSGLASANAGFPQLACFLSMPKLEALAACIRDHESGLLWQHFESVRVGLNFTIALH